MSLEIKNVACATVLVLLALLLAFSSSSARWLSGHHPLTAPDLAALDDLSKADSGGTTEIFEVRNRLDVEVRREMSVGEFLRLHRLHAFPHVRAEMAATLGVEELPDAQLLEPGQVFAITLTEPERGIP